RRALGRDVEHAHALGIAQGTHRVRTYIEKDPGRGLGRSDSRFGRGLWREGNDPAPRGVLEISPDFELDADGAVDAAAAERPRERRLLLRRLQLDDARDAPGATAVHQLERMHRPERLAQREDVPGQPTEVAGLRWGFDKGARHGRLMLVPSDGTRLSPSA